MSPLVQNALAIGLCVVAAIFIAWRAWKALAGRKSHCGTGCGSCSSSGEQAQMPKALLSIDANPNDASRGRNTN